MLLMTDQWVAACKYSRAFTGRDEMVVKTKKIILRVITTRS